MILEDMVPPAWSKEQEEVNERRMRADIYDRVIDELNQKLADRLEPGDRLLKSACH